MEFDQIPKSTCSFMRIFAVNVRLKSVRVWEEFAFYLKNKQLKK